MNRFDLAKGATVSVVPPPPPKPRQRYAQSLLLRPLWKILYDKTGQLKDRTEVTSNLMWLYARIKPRRRRYA